MLQQLLLLINALPGEEGTLLKESVDESLLPPMVRGEGPVERPGASTGEVG